MQYNVTIAARKEGAIGAMGTEIRSYLIEAERFDNVSALAIDRAYKEGGLEHVKVIRIREL